MRMRSFGEHGFTEKEFVGEELEDVEPDEEPNDSDLENLSFDDDDYLVGIIRRSRFYAK